MPFKEGFLKEGTGQTEGLPRRREVRRNCTGRKRGFLFTPGPAQEFKSWLCPFPMASAWHLLYRSLYFSGIKWEQKSLPHRVAVKMKQDYICKAFSMVPGIQQVLNK